MVQGSGSERVFDMSLIDRGIQDCIAKITITTNSEEAKAQYTERIQKDAQTLRIIDTTITNLKYISGGARAYNNDKREHAEQGIYSGIYASRNIIPSAHEVKVEIKNKSMKLMVPIRPDTYVPINNIEGSAHRSILSLFTRGVVLDNTEHMAFMVLDEYLAMLSQETSATTSEYIDVLADGHQLILMEQKKEIYEKLKCKKYILVNDEGETKILKEE